MLIRAVTLKDVPALQRLEMVCFPGDRLNLRSFRYFVRQKQHCFLLAESAEGIGAYVLVLTRRNSPVARLYSLAVDPVRRGQGLARALLQAAEQQVREQGATRLQLEVRRDNERAMAVYQRLGYQVFGEYAGYYEDGEDALRMCKSW
ncbi:MAG: N-acetyltransferase [Thiolinea sp.]